MLSKVDSLQVNFSKKFNVIRLNFMQSNGPQWYPNGSNHIMQFNIITQFNGLLNQWDLIRFNGILSNQCISAFASARLTCGTKTPNMKILWFGMSSLWLKSHGPTGRLAKWSKGTPYLLFYYFKKISSTFENSSFSKGGI